MKINSVGPLAIRNLGHIQFTYLLFWDESWCLQRYSIVFNCGSGFWVCHMVAFWASSEPYPGSFKGDRQTSFRVQKWYFIHFCCSCWRPRRNMKVWSLSKTVDPWVWVFKSWMAIHWSTRAHGFPTLFPLGKICLGWSATSMFTCIQYTDVFLVEFQLLGNSANLMMKYGWIPRN